LQDQVNEGRQNKNVGAKTALLEGKQKIFGNKVGTAPLKLITLGQTISDYNKRLKNLQNFLCIYDIK
jgi:hypothetical protein